MNIVNSFHCFLFSLLNRERKSIELHLPKRPFAWNQVRTDHLLHPGQINNRDIFRLHWAVDLEVYDEDHAQKIEGIKQLRLLAGCGRLVLSHIF